MTLCSMLLWTHPCVETELHLKMMQPRTQLADRSSSSQALQLLRSKQVGYYNHCWLGPRCAIEVYQHRDIEA